MRNWPRFIIGPFAVAIGWYLGMLIAHQSGPLGSYAGIVYFAPALLLAITFGALAWRFTR